MSKFEVVPGPPDRNATRSGYDEDAALELLDYALDHLDEWIKFSYLDLFPGTPEGDTEKRQIHRARNFALRARTGKTPLFAPYVVESTTRGTDIYLRILSAPQTRRALRDRGLDDRSLP